jgi:hypothetical protein
MSPGDLVVCVNVGAIPGSHNLGLSRLTLGSIYTIKDVGWSSNDPGFGVDLVEVDSVGCRWGHLQWNPKRFRPCRKTNIDELVALVKERECEGV